MGLQQRDLISCALEKCDLVIAVGYDLIEYSPKKWNPDGKTSIINGTEAAKIDSSYIPLVEVVGDISDSLMDILKRADRQGKLTEVVTGLRKKIVADYKQYAHDKDYPIRPQKIIYDLRQVMGPEDIVISDVGAHKMWIARHYHCDPPNTCLIYNGFAAMGIAIPGAIAAK